MQTRTKPSRPEGNDPARRRGRVGTDRKPWPDPRDLRLHRPPDKRDVPYVPTEWPVVQAMLDFAGVAPGDVLFDLGCGDGRIPITAAKRGARSYGVDVDLQRIKECYWNARHEGVGAERARFLRQSFFDTDLREASVVTLYLLTCINVRLRPKLLWELRPGTRIVANFFDMGDWPPDATTQCNHRTLFKWIVPAWIGRSYKCVVCGGDGPNDRHHHMTLDLHRRYQQVWGTATIGRRAVPIRSGKMTGDELTIVLPEARELCGGAVMPLRFTAKLAHDGHTLRGVHKPDGVAGPDAAGHAWCGALA